MRLKVESEERNMVLTILRTTGVVTLIDEDKVRRIGSTTDENREGTSLLFSFRPELSPLSLAYLPLKIFLLIIKHAHN